MYVHAETAEHYLEKERLIHKLFLMDFSQRKPSEDKTTLTCQHLTSIRRYRIRCAMPHKYIQTLLILTFTLPDVYILYPVIHGFLSYAISTHHISMLESSYLYVILLLHAPSHIPCLMICDGDQEIRYYYCILHEVRNEFIYEF